MWREHDAKLASVWRRDQREVAPTDTVIVLPEPVESIAQTA
jgi:hypothetical protein